MKSELILTFRIWEEQTNDSICNCVAIHLSANDCKKTTRQYCGRDIHARCLYLRPTTARWCSENLVPTN
jgi:hypothetical protein